MPELRALTGLRGVAALMVVGVHAGPVLVPDAPRWLGRFLAHGQFAVDLFFVLSGFVLAYGQGGLQASEVPGFLWRRAWRIYPLHVVVLGMLAAYVLLATLGGDRFIAPDFPWSRFAPTLLLLQPFLFHNATDWNPPDWSIAVEMVCSLGFWPALVGLRRVGRPRLMAGVLALVAAANLGLHSGETVGLPALLRGMCGFGFGLALARVQAPGWQQGGAPQPAGRARDRPTAGSRLRTWQEVLVGMGFLVSVATDQPAAAIVLAGGLILLLAGEAGALSRSLARRGGWLGRVSFSVYLVHVPLLIPFEGGWAWALGWPERVGVCVTYVMGVLGVATLVCCLVERPGQALAGSVSRRCHGLGRTLRRRISRVAQA